MNHSVARDINQLLKYQLTLVNQLFIHSKIQSKSDLSTLSQKYAQMAVRGGKTAEMLISILIDFGYTPNAKNYDLMTIENDIEKQLNRDLELNITSLNYCHTILQKANSSIGILNIMRPTLNHFESSVDFLSSQKEIIDAIGPTIYINNMKTTSLVR